MTNITIYMDYDWSSKPIHRTLYLEQIVWKDGGQFIYEHIGMTNPFEVFIQKNNGKYRSSKQFSTFKDANEWLKDFFALDDWEQKKGQK